MKRAVIIIIATVGILAIIVFYTRGTGRSHPAYLFKSGNKPSIEFAVRKVESVPQKGAKAILFEGQKLLLSSVDELWNNDILGTRVFSQNQISLYADDPPVQELVLEIFFTPQGTRKFSRITKDQLGKRIAVLFDGKVISAPTTMGVVEGAYVRYCLTLKIERMRKPWPKASLVSRFRS